MTYTTDSTLHHPLAIDTASIQSTAAPSAKGSLPSPPESPTQRDRDLEAARSTGSPSYSPPLAGAYQQAPFGEGASRPGSISADPLLLSSRLRTDEDMAQLRKRNGSKAKAKTLQAFYERQNGQIKDLLKPMDDHINEAKLDEESNSRAVSLLIRRVIRRG